MASFGVVIDSNESQSPKKRHITTSDISQGKHSRLFMAIRFKSITNRQAKYDCGGLFLFSFSVCNGRISNTIYIRLVGLRQGNFQLCRDSSAREGERTEEGLTPTQIC